MAAISGLDALTEHLQRVTRLDRREARRLVEEVLAYFSETPSEFVTRRHGELRREGLTNTEAFEAIRAELCERRFTAPGLSARQVRRLIYG